MLTSKQRAFLRGLANTLPVTQQIGKEGVTEAVIRQVEQELQAKELMKLKVLESSLLTPRQASDRLCQALDAQPVQCIGNKLVLYKSNPKKPEIVLPKER